jgi:Protein of unknown function (DUF3606)
MTLERCQISLRSSEPKPGDNMSDDLSNRGPKDRARVNVNEPWELTYWCKKFNCTEAQLRAAVKAVGPMVTEVQKHLGK